MKEESSGVMAFDALYTNNQIQKLKVLLPYIEPSMQKHMAIYIKYMELNYTINLFKKHPFQICSTNKAEKPDLGKLCRELKPYCTEGEAKQLDQMSSIFQTMEMYQEMSQTMSSMQELFPNMGADMGNNGSSSSMESLLMGMLSPEQKAMFEAFSNQEPTNQANKET
ncbi:MAG: hypothetical protein PUD93_07300 [Lachnospiraceae bacterium]|nr:hypothetical protein [Lachnospiraceae bacterium]